MEGRLLRSKAKVDPTKKMAQRKRTRLRWCMKHRNQDARDGRKKKKKKQATREKARKKGLEHQEQQYPQ
ncbi:hypothetical protein PRIC1_009053 [Phytophthora ramorum]